MPDDVQALFDWWTLRVESVSFISDELQRRFADLRFTIRLIGDTVDRRITLLFDHKRRTDYTTPRQLHGYIAQMMEETPNNEPLPSILTVVLLQSRKWNRAHTLSSEYDLPDAARAVLGPYLTDFRMVLVELARLDESGLKGTVAGRFALALLKAVGEGEPMGFRRFRGILRDVCRKLERGRLYRQLRIALEYLLGVTDETQEAEVRGTIQSVPDEFLPLKEQMMMLLEHLEERGEKRGRVSTLARLLSAAFPEFSSADTARLEELPDEALDELTDAVALRRTWGDIYKLLRRKTR